MNKSLYKDIQRFTYYKRRWRFLPHNTIFDMLKKGYLNGDKDVMLNKLKL